MPEDPVSRHLASLPHPYTIIDWKDASGCIRPVTLQDESGTLVEGRAFVKTVHLLDPIGLLHDEYMNPSHPLLPQGKASWKQTLLKLHSKSNQAYVDAVASYAIGMFRHAGMTPHGVISYGSMTGIADTYSYSITDEYKSYRNCRWFWNGLATNEARLSVKKGDVDVMADPDYADLVKEHFTCPIEYDKADEVLLPLLGSDMCMDDQGSLHSFDFDETDSSPPALGQGAILIPCAPGSHRDDEDEDEDGDEDEDEDGDEDGDEDEEGGSSTSSESTQMDVHVTLKSMPVILICQEAHEGTMDDLMEEDTLSMPNGGECERGTPEWERTWTAWTFQIIAQLAFLQKQIGFTHNDLHTNNIVWRATEDPYLYYKASDGTQFRVPTYGRIFSLIDFGRAIFKLNGDLLVSDDHWPDHDAGGQYNFGPFYSIEQPKIGPNMSFDLCRLAISMLEGLFSEVPAKKKGTHVILSQEGDWKVFETVSPLYNLLWSWTLDDDGQTVYEDEEGDEKFPGFSLYIQIAHRVHDAVPRDQVRKPLFESYRSKQGAVSKEPGNKIVYPLGC